MNPIGVIAEEVNDVDVVRCIIAKIAKRNVPIQKFVGHGCSKVRAKCRSWAYTLRAGGCRLLVIMHDSDTGDPAKVRNELEQRLGASPIALHIIVIPIREIEAWLLADHQAIGQAMRLAQPMKRVANPERVMNPKEHLRDQIFIRSGHKTRYLNTVHNKKIAEVCKLTNLRRCASFVPLEEFLNAHLRRFIASL